MLLFARWLAGKDGGKPALPFYDMSVLRMAERYHVLPDAIEKMDSYWFERTMLLMEAEAKKAKLQ